ncbi:MAG: NAD-dependent epimerase/dehydratase family protein [Candidatus Dormibacteria bacterium]
MTGGAGFIGSNLVDALLETGEQVTVIDDFSRGRREQVAAGADLHQMDVGEDGLTALIGEVAPDVVFHHAAQIDVRRSVAEPMLDTRINVLGMVNLLGACAAAGVGRVVFASSGGALYGDTDAIPTTEDHPAQPESIYGAAKLAGEVYGQVFSRLHSGMDFVALRYGNVYGPRQDPHGEAGVVAIFIQRLLRGEPAVINGDGRQTRDYVYVDDVIRANLAAARAPSLGPYNVGTGRETDVNEIHRLIAAACGDERPPTHGEAKRGEQRRSCLDATRAQRELDWRPQVDLAEGIGRTVDYFRPG